MRLSLCTCALLRTNGHHMLAPPHFPTQETLRDITVLHTPFVPQANSPRAEMLTIPPCIREAYHVHNEEISSSGTILLVRSDLVESATLVRIPTCNATILPAGSLKKPWDTTAVVAVQMNAVSRNQQCEELLSATESAEHVIITGYFQFDMGGNDLSPLRNLPMSPLIASPGPINTWASHGPQVAHCSRVQTGASYYQTIFAEFTLS